MFLIHKITILLKISLPISSTYCHLFSIYLLQLQNNKSKIPMNYNYLTPPSKVKKIKFPKNYIYQEIGGKHKRRIFGKPPYQPFEVEHINKLKDYLNKKSPFTNYPEQLLLRFVYQGNFLISQSIEEVKQHDQWHENQVITNLQRAGRDILENGHIYSFGRDYDYCPVIIVKAAAIDLTKYTPEDYYSAIANLLEALESNMLVPGVVEKWNVLVDFQNKKQNVSDAEFLIRSLKRIAPAYPFRLKRLLFLNSDSKHTAIKGELTRLVFGEGSEVEVRTINDMGELAQLIPQDEREKKYGGYLRDLNEYWPILTTNKYEESQSEPDSDLQYKSVLNDQGYFQEKGTFCHCGEGKCIIY